MSTEIVRLRINAVAVQSLLLATEPQVGNRRGSALEIAGTMLRGALAARWIRQHGDPGEQFHELFDSGVVWPTLRPEHHVLVPLSVRRCKYRRLPGCRRMVADVFDPQPSEADVEEHRCTSCEGFLELAKGELLNTGPGSDAARTSRTTSALDANEIPVDEQLFTRDGVPKGTCFSGDVVLDSTLTPATAQWIEDLAGTEIRVGGRRSVSGTLRIESVSLDTSAVTTTIAEGARVAVRLTHPAIVIDPRGRCSSDPHQLLDAVAHDGALRLTTGHADRPASFLRPIQISGWNALAGIPKVTETALAAGSTLICEVTRALSADDIARMVRHGVGVRRNEGFGSITIDTEPWSLTPDDGATAGTAATEPAATERPHLLAQVDHLTDPADRHRHLEWSVDRLHDAAARLRPHPDLDRAELVADLRELRSIREINMSVVEALIAVLRNLEMRADELSRLRLRLENERDELGEARS